jgi:mono/diheme cytochrome c family protein
MLFRIQGEGMARVSLFFGSAVLLALTACSVSKPGSVEKSVMGEIKKTVTIGDKDKKNPVPFSDDTVKEGQEHFGHHCPICHGMDGQNTGVPFAEKMSPPVADLASKDIQDYTDGQLHWILENGIAPSGMPSWKGILDDDEMWKIVHFIRHLPPKGSLGTPDIFKEEAEEHEHAEQKAGKHTHTHAPGTPPHKD